MTFPTDSRRASGARSGRDPRAPGSFLALRAPPPPHAGRRRKTKPRRWVRSIPPAGNDPSSSRTRQGRAWSGGPGMSSPDMRYASRLVGGLDRTSPSSALLRYRGNGPPRILVPPWYPQRAEPRTTGTRCIGRTRDKPTPPRPDRPRNEKVVGSIPTGGSTQGPREIGGLRHSRPRCRHDRSPAASELVPPWSPPRCVSLQRLSSVTVAVSSTTLRVAMRDHQARQLSPR